MSNLPVQSNLTPNLLYKRVCEMCEVGRDVTPELIFELFVSGKMLDRHIRGGSGDWRRTKHEVMFSILFPELKRQMSFGTGRGGLREYGSTKFVADFYDEKANVVYEIDGPSHATRKAKIRDINKALCLLELYGIRVRRITNQGVERLMKKRIALLFGEGELGNVC